MTLPSLDGSAPSLRPRFRRTSSSASVVHLPLTKVGIEAPHLRLDVGPGEVTVAEAGGG